MTGYPSVTIITPVYNGEKFIQETIKSILDQNYPNLEYIVLDDGSTDRTAEMIKPFEGKIKLIRQTNIGHPQTVNKGFSLAEGDILSVVNADDPLRPGAIDFMARELVSDLGIIVAYPDWDLIDENGDVIETIQPPDYEYSSMVNWHKCLPGPGAFFRRSILKQISGWNEEYRYVYDFEFWLRAGLLGEFKHINQNLAAFRWHASSKSAGQQGKLMAAEHVRLMRNYFKLPGLSQKKGINRRQAMSSAYYIGGTVVGENEWLKKWYFLKAWILFPFACPDDFERKKGEHIRWVLWRSVVKSWWNKLS